MATKTKSPKKATKAKGTTKSKSVKKPAKVSKAKLDDKNVKDTVLKVVETKRELRYIYPEEMTDQILRKKYRQKVRNAIYKYERDITKLEGKELKAMEKEYATYRKEVLQVP